MTDKDIGTQLDRMARKVAKKLWPYIEYSSVSMHLERDDIAQEAIVRYLTLYGTQIPELEPHFYRRMYFCGLKLVEKEIRRNNLVTFIEYLEEDEEKT